VADPKHLVTRRDYNHVKPRRRNARYRETRITLPSRSAPMSQDPNPYGNSFSPIPSLSANGSSQNELNTDPQVSKLRGSTKTIAILLLVIGISGILSFLFQIGVGLVLGLLANSQPGNADLQISYQSFKANMSSWQVIFLLLALIINVALLIGSIGTLKRKKGLASLLVQSALVSAIFVFLGTAWGTYFQFTNRTALLADLKNQLNNSPNGQNADLGSFMEVMFMVQLVFGVLIALAHIVFYLFSFFHLRKKETLAQMR